MIRISCDNLNKEGGEGEDFVERGRFFKVWKKRKRGKEEEEEGEWFGQGSPRRAFGDAGASRGRGREGGR